jgi:hypothetical protein
MPSPGPAYRVSQLVEKGRNALADFSEDSRAVKARNDEAAQRFRQSSASLPPTAMEQAMQAAGGSLQDVYWHLRGTSPRGQADRAMAQRMAGQPAQLSPEDIEFQRRLAEFNANRARTPQAFPMTPEAIEAERIATLMMQMNQGHNIPLEAFPEEYVHVRKRNALAQ